MGKIISIYHLHLKLRRVKTMREEPSTTKKLSSRHQKCVSSGFSRERCKRNHDFIKRAWNERSCSIYRGIGDEMEQSERQKQPLASQSRENGKDEYKPRQVVITENETMNLIASKTRKFKRTLYSETFKLKTVVRAFFSREGSTVREEITADEQSSTEILKPDEFMYRPNAPNIRRKAICDEIEKCIVQSGAGSLRSLRSDLIVAANLKTWQLI